MPKSPLTERRRVFCERLASGMTPYQANQGLHLNYTREAKSSAGRAAIEKAATAKARGANVDELSAHVHAMLEREPGLAPAPRFSPDDRRNVVDGQVTVSFQGDHLAARDRAIADTGVSTAGQGIVWDSDREHLAELIRQKWLAGGNARSPDRPIAIVDSDPNDLWAGWGSKF